MSIATVVSITGQAWARDPDGNLRELAVGDTLQEGETLVTSTNGNVQLDFDDGLPPTTIGGDEEVAITNDVDAENAPTEEETVAQDGEVEALLSALEEEDGDLLELLEATAAGGGAAGGGGGGGADFVQLARIEESVQGLQYDYAVGADEGPETIEFAAAPADADDEIEGNPTAGLTSITLDESQLVSGEQSQFNSLTATGSIDFSFGPLGAGSIGFAGMDGQTLTIGQESFNLDWDAASNTLTASNERVQASNSEEPFLFQVEIDPQTGDFTLTLANNLLHEEGAEEALASLVYTVTDAGGNTASNSLGITIVDDGPSVELEDVDLSEVSLETQDSQTIDGGTSTATGSVAAAFDAAVTAQYGADGEGSTAISGYALTLGDIDHGLESNGEPITFSLADGVITGSTADDTEVLRIEIDGNGEITVTQSAALDHAEQGADSLSLPTGLVGVEATVTVTDGDGDTTSETLSADLGDSISIVDDMPSIVDGTVDLSEVSLETQDSQTIDGGTSTATGSVAAAFDAAVTAQYGADGEGSTAISGYALTLGDIDHGLESNGEPITFSLADGVITGSTADDTEVLRIEIDGNGEITVTQSAALDHAEQGADSLSLPTGLVGVEATVTVTDGDGDTTSETLSADLGDSINIVDDMPSIVDGTVDLSEVSLETQDSQTIDGGTSTATGSVAAAFDAAVTAQYGADGEGSTAISGYALTLGDLDHGLESNGEPITFSLADGVITGSTADDTEVLRIEIDGNGEITVTQSAALDHAEQGADSLSLPTGLVGVEATVTVTDGDGDTTSETLSADLGDSINIVDDMPSIVDGTVDLSEVSLETQDSQTIDGGTSTATGSVAAAFDAAVTAQYGADGEGSTAISGYALTLGDLDHGLESNGEPITFSLADGVITGSTEAGEVLRLEVDSDGNVTVTQSAALDHAEQGADSLSLPTGLVGVEATVTVTDGDGDTTSETLSADLGDSISIVDDMPSIVDGTVDLSEVSLETQDSQTIDGGTSTATGSVAAAFDAAVTAQYGADGEGSTAISGYALTLGDIDHGLESNGEPITFSLADGVITGSTADDTEVLRIEIDGNGEITVTQSAALDHAEQGADSLSLPTGLVGVEATVTVTDGDGDTTSETLSADLGDSINIVDDMPSIVDGTVDLSEVSLETQDSQTIDGGTSTATGSVAAAFDAAVTAQYGADGEGSTAISGYALTLGDIDHGLESNGEPITFSLADGVITGSTADDTEVLRIEIDGNGEITVTQSAALDHAEQGADSLSLPTGLVGVEATVTVTDGDGDTTSETLSADLGDSINIVDDMPSIVDGTVDLSEVSLETQDSQTIDGGTSTATGSVAAAFDAAVTAQYGADGEGSTAISGYALTLGDLDHGLESNGEPITFSLADGVITGSTADDTEVLRIEIDGNGEITVTQSAALDHAEQGADSLSLPTGLVGVEATVTVTDGDGDTTSETLSADLGDSISIVDDMPSIELGGPDEATEGGDVIDGTWVQDVGADGAGSTAVEFGGESYALGEAIDTGSGTLTVNSDGTWTFAGGTNVSENDAISFDLVTTDSDNDVARSTHTVSVVDGDGPTPGDSDGEGATLSLTLTDADTEGNATDSTDGQLSFTAGSDDLTTFAFGDTDGLTVSGLDGDLTWTTDTGGNLVGSLNGNDVLRLSLSNTGTINAQTSGTVTVTAELLSALPHDTSVDELTINGLNVVASEADGDSATATVNMTVNDAQPENSLSGPAEATEGGDVIDGTWSEDVGADGAGSTAVEFGGESYALGEAIDTGSGTLTVNSDGTWTFAGGTNVSENDAISFDLVTTDSDNDVARSTHTVSVVDGDGPTPGDSDGEGATLSLTLTDADTEGNATDSTDGQLSFTAGSDDLTTFAFGDTDGLTVSGLDGDLTWTTDSATGNLVGSLNGTPVLQLSLSNTGTINAQTSGSVTVTAELLSALPHDTSVDELTINGLSVVASEADGDSATATVNMTVNDAQPENSLSGPAEATEGGDVIDGTWSEDVGADGAGSTAVEFGGESYALGEAIDTGSGTLTVNSDGTWTFAGGTNVSENDAISFDLVTTDSDNDVARSTHTVSVVDGDGPTPGDSDGEGATLSLTLTDADTEGNATDSTDGQLSFTAGSDDLTTFAFGDTDGLTVSGLDGDLTWTTDSATGNLVGSLNGTPVLQLSLSNTGTINAQTSGSVTVTAELLSALPHDTSVDELTINGLNVVASEADGDSATATVNMTVNDAQPENSLSGPAEATEGGDVIDGTWTQDVGADGAGTTTVEYDGESYALGEAIDTGSGTLTVNSDGTWTFAGGTNVSENDAISFDLVTTDSDNDVARSTHTVSVVDGDGPTPGDSDGEGATLSLTLTDADTEGNATDSTDGQLSFTAGSDDLTTFAFGDTDGLTVSGLDGDLTWTTDTGGNLVGSLNGNDVLRLSLSNTGTINAQTSGSVTVTAELLSALPHDTSVDELTINGLSVIASEADGDSATGTVDVQVNDDGPAFNEDIEDASLSTAVGSEATGDLNLDIGADLEGAQISGATLKQDEDGYIQVQYEEGGATQSAFLTSGGSKLQYEFDQDSQQLIAFKQGDSSSNPVFTIDFDVTNGSYEINVIEALDPVTVGFENAGVTSNGGGTGLALELDGADLNAVFTMQDGGNVNWSNTGIGGSPNNLIGNGDVLVANFDQVLTELSFTASRGVGNPQTAEWKVYLDGQEVGSGTGNSIAGIEGGFDEVHFIGHGQPNDQYRVNDFGGRYQDSSIDYQLPVEVDAIDGDGDTADSGFTIGFDPESSSIDLPDPEEPAAPSVTGGEVLINEAWLPGGTREGQGDTTQEGSIQLTAEGGIASLTVGGETLDFAALQDLGNNPVSIQIDGIGTLSLTGFQGTDTGGTLSYELTLDDNVNHDDVQGRNNEEFGIDLSIVDLNGESDSGTLDLVVKDDVPESESDTTALDVVIDEFGIDDIDGNWSNASGSSSAYVSNGIGIVWGGSNFNQASGYKFEYADNIDAEESVVSGDPVSLGTFTHVNNSVSSGSAINAATLSLNVDVVLNGTTYSIPVEVQIDHNETPNDYPDGDSRNNDIITIESFSITDPSITEALTAAGYEFTISGFRYEDGGSVGNQVSTKEGQSTSFELLASIDYVGEPATAEGSISADWGADGPAENDPITVAHENGNTKGLDSSGQAVIEGAYGTLTLTDDGNGEYSYAYVLSQAGRQALKSEGNLTENFSYTLKDGDGDEVTRDITLNLTGVTAPIELVDSSNDAFIDLVEGADYNAWEKGDVDAQSYGNGKLDSETKSHSFTINEGESASVSFYVDTNVEGPDGYAQVSATLFKQNSNGGWEEVKSVGSNDGWESFSEINEAGSYQLEIKSYAQGRQFEVSWNNIGWVYSSASAENIKIDVTPVVENTSDATGNILTEDGVSLGSNDTELQVELEDGFEDVTDGMQVAGKYGTLTLNQDGSYTYQPDSEIDNLGGVDEFNYQVTNSDGDSETATLSIRLNSNTENVQFGGEGDNTLEGGNSLDILVGGAGNDTLTGGEGDDVFRWNFGDEGTVGQPADDTVTDFGNGNDKLDLSDLLQGEDSGNINEYIFAEEEGDNVVLSISSEGNLNGSTSGADQKITLEGKSFNDFGVNSGVSEDLIAKLVEDGQLKIDQ